MKIHVLTHAVVEDDLVEIWAMMAEYVDRVRESAAIKSMTFEVGRDLGYASDQPVKLQRCTSVKPVLLIAPEDYGKSPLMGEHSTGPLGPITLRRLAADAIQMAEFIEKHEHEHEETAR